ncbi:unnamed protein product [Caenorhabditis brenneri]
MENQLSPQKIEELWPFGVILVAVLIVWYFARKRNDTPNNKPHPKTFRYLKQSTEITRIEHEDTVVLCSKTPRSSCCLLPKWNSRLQTILDRHYGRKIGGASNFKIPDGALAISIPRKYFKCGKEPTDFEPRDQKSGEYSYEMYRNNLQITWFKCGNTKYLAGFCIYLFGFPYTFNEFWINKAFKEGSTYKPFQWKDLEIRKKWCKYWNRWILITNNQLGEIDKFVFNDKENQVERVNCSDCIWDEEQQTIEEQPIISNVKNQKIPLNALKSLKVEFCEIEKKPIMIGNDQFGVIKHFKWNPVNGRFEVKHCKSCEEAAKQRFDAMNDEPPTYEFLELIDLVEG